MTISTPLKRRGSTLSDREVNVVKKPHVSVLELEVSGGRIKSTDMNLSNVSDISLVGSGVFDDTGDAIANMGDSQPDAISVPHSTLKEILNQLKYIKAENAELRKNVVSLESKIDTLNTKLICQNDEVPNNPEPSNSATGRKLIKAKRSILPQNPVAPTQVSDTELKSKVNNWGKRFHQRRNNYRNCDKNLKHAAIYSEFLEGQKPYIPKKFRPRFARDKFDFNLAERNSIHEMQIQKERYLYFAELADQKFRQIDEQMISEINGLNDRVVSDRLKKLWDKEVKIAEEKTDRLNEKELEFLSKLPETDPYDGYVEEAVNGRHHNGGFYKRNYYRNAPRSSNAPSFH